MQWLIASVSATSVYQSIAILVHLMSFAEFFQVDISGFQTEMKAQRQRSKDSAKTVDLEMGGALAGLGNQLDATLFKGYHDMEGHAKVVAIMRGGDSVPSAGKGEEPSSGSSGE